jgi:hypothetical protein
MCVRAQSARLLNLQQATAGLLKVDYLTNRKMHGGKSVSHSISF